MDGRLDGMILSNAQDRAVEDFPSFPGYDDNGNVIGYWDESGSIVAEYAYDAFGDTSRRRPARRVAPRGSAC